MKNITRLKVYFDTLLFLLFLLDYNTMMRSLGAMYWHEISGLFVGGLIIIHMMIDWKWIKQVTINLFQKQNCRLRAGLQYWMDVLFFLDDSFCVYYLFLASAVQTLFCRTGNLATCNL